MPLPRMVSTKILEIDITGYLMPMDSTGRPFLICMTGTDDRFLPIYSDKQTLDASFAECGFECRSIMQIDDGPEFLQSVSENDKLFRLRIAVDPHRKENGMIGYTEILQPFTNP